MGPLAVWILALGMSLSAIYRYRTAGLPTRYMVVSIVVSTIAGLLFAIVSVGAIGVTGGAAIWLLIFGMVSHAFIKGKIGRERNREQIRQRFEAHPEMYTKFQNHRYLGRQVRRFDEKDRKSRKH